MNNPQSLKVASDSSVISLADFKVHLILMIMVMIVMIALKGSIRDFYNLLTEPRTVSNTYVQVARPKSCATPDHVQHIERLSRATCRMPRGNKGQFSYQV